MWHLPSLQQIYSAVFTILQHTCREQICANPSFRPVLLLLYMELLRDLPILLTKFSAERRNGQGKSDSESET